MAPPHPKALLVAVSFRDPEVVHTLLESLRQLEEFRSLRIVIADNASGEETVAAIRQNITGLANVELVESPVNRGYFGGARFGLDRYLSQSVDWPDWVIVSNPDIVIEDRAFLRRLFQLDPGSVGMVAPRIVVPWLRLNQNPFMRKRPGGLRRFTLRVHLRYYFLSVAWDWLSRIKRLVRSKLAGTAATEGTGGPIYAPHGSFLIFSRKYFESGGYLDDQLFLYGEEIAVGEICRELGLQVIYNPSISVIHNEHRSLGVGMTRAKFIYHRQSMQRVFSRYLAS